MLRAILFDLDGTLIDSEPWHKKAELEVFNALGLEVGPDDISMYVGNTLPFMLEDLSKRFGKRITQDEFIEAQQPVLGKHIDEDIQLFPDVRPMLARLSGVLTAVVTSSVEWYVSAIRRRFPELEPVFGTLVCEKDVSNGKPHPEPFVLAANLLGLPTSECMVVEDSVNGVKAGKLAGCFVVGIDREGHGRLGEADRVVKSLFELGQIK